MPPTQDRHHARRWWILALLGVAQLMVALAFGSLLLLGGRISDLFGRKWTLIGGLAGFAVASAVGGAAPSFGVLVAARAV